MEEIPYWKRVERTNFKPIPNQKPLSEFVSESIALQLEEEKKLLEKNSREVLGLIAEKDPGTLTEKAKSLLSRLKNISALKVDTLDSAAFLAFSALTIAVISPNSPIPPEYKELANGALAIIAAASLLGVASIKKYNETMQKLYSNMKPA
jgi:hypothetical protein